MIGGAETRRCTSSAPASRSIFDDLARRRAAHDRVVDDHQPLARDRVRERVELQPHAVLAQRLVGLDERAPDVAVLDQAVANGMPEARA